MPVVANYDRENKMVVSIFSGHVTLWDLKEDAVISFIIGEKYQTTLFLADTTGIRTTDIEAPDIFDQTNFYDDIKAARSIKVAILQPPSDHPIRNHIAIFESAFLNAGWQIKTFEDRSAAIDWLTAPDSSNPSDPTELSCPE